MTTIGVTGHLNLTRATVILVRAAIVEALAEHAATELVGMSCLAAGADTIFAEVVLERGGQLVAVIPAADYRDRVVKPAARKRFDELIRRATEVRTMHARSGEDAYKAANEVLLASCDRLLAVWDGVIGANKGGSAAMVAAAKARGLPVEVLWPKGAKRTRPRAPARIVS